MTGISRRRLNLGIGISSLSCLSGRKLAAFESCDVVVIGAGLAGLNAALNLEADGLNVMVLEAESYVGGRTLTVDFPSGPMNVGGQTIGPYYARVRDLADRFSIKLNPVGGRVPMGNYVNGSLIASSDWAQSEFNKTIGKERSVQPGALEFFYLSQKNPLPDVESWLEKGQQYLDVPLVKFLKGQGASDEAIRLINVTINVSNISAGSALAYLRDIKRLQWGIDNKDDAENRSTYGAGSHDGFEFSEVDGGTQRLLETMAGALKGPVHLNTMVKSVDMSGSMIDITTTSGDRVKSKYVVSAVPFTALRNINVYPNFGSLQGNIISQSSHANTIRVFMECTAPFWDNDIGEPGLYTDTEIERVFARPDDSGTYSILECWVNGAATVKLDAMSDTEVAAFIIKRLGEIRPASVGKLKVIKVHSWAKHTASGCCRHVFDAGQIDAWAASMGTPHLKLHLAGEQTRSIENGMEAAAKSGERAAFEILERGI